MQIYDIRERIRVGIQKNTGFKYIGEVKASSGSEAKKVIAERKGIPSSRLEAKLRGNYDTTTG